MNYCIFRASKVGGRIIIRKNSKGRYLAHSRADIEKILVFSQQPRYPVFVRLEESNWITMLPNHADKLWEYIKPVAYALCKLGYFDDIIEAGK